MKFNRTLLKGSAVLLVSFGIYNFFNFIFQLSMARLLSIVDYGIFATLFAMLYILTIFTESIQIIITKYSSVEKEEGKLKNIMKKSLKKSFMYALFLFVIYLIVAIPLVYFLRIEYSLLAFTGLMIFTAFLLPVCRGMMQGRKKFKSLGGNMIFEAVVKLMLAVIFVLIGWRVFGAILGAILGTGLAFFVSLLPLRKILGEKESKSETTGIYNYAKPAFIINTIIIVFYSIDIIIAKIVFSPEIVGGYAIASILSKAIFWGTQPISRAMFPLASGNEKISKGSSNIFGNSLALLVIGLLTALFLFYFFPELIINIFAGRIVPEAVSVLFFLGIGTGVLSITNLILLHKLSVNKTKGYKYLAVFLVMEVVLLFYFSSNIIQFSIAFITASVALLWGSIILFKE